MPLAFSDFAEGGARVPVIFADPESGATACETLDAALTHDGFQMLAVPVGDGRLGAALVLGALGEWVEIAGIGLVPIAGFMAEATGDLVPPEPMTGVGDGMVEVAPGRWRAEHAGGFVFVQPPVRRVGENLMLAVTFRVVVGRAAAG